MTDTPRRWAPLCRRPDPHDEVDHDERLACACPCHGPGGEPWRPPAVAPTGDTT